MDLRVFASAALVLAVAACGGGGNSTPATMQEVPSATAAIPTVATSPEEATAEETQQAPTPTPKYTGTQKCNKQGGTVVAKEVDGDVKCQVTIKKDMARSVCTNKPGGKVVRDPFSKKKPTDMIGCSFFEIKDIDDDFDND